MIFLHVIVERSRADVVQALELAHRIDEYYRNGTNVKLELYHHSSLSPFLTAKLESYEAVKVVDIKTSSSSCIVDSLLITGITDVVLVETSIVFISQPSQSEKKESLAPTSICNPTSTSLRAGTVTSTSFELDKGLQKFVNLQKNCKFQHASSYQSGLEAGTITKEDIFIKDISGDVQSSYVGAVHIPGRYSHGLFLNTPTFAFIYPLQGNIELMSYHSRSKFVCGESGSLLDYYDGDLSSQLVATFHRYNEWKRILLLDRPVGWIAYDGGIVPQDTSIGSIPDGFCSSFNSLEGAKRSIIAGGDTNRTMLNIDLVLTSDGENVAMHDSTTFGPIAFGNQVKSVVSMTLADVENTLRNPCLSNTLIQQWFDENAYRSYDTCQGCSHSITRAIQFIDDVALGYNTDIIFDLKGTNILGQESQVRQILSMIQNDSRSESEKRRLLERVAIRYFSVDKNQDLSLEVLPDHIYAEIDSGRFPRELKVYVNTPSREACVRLVQWAKGKGANLAGCFVVEGHDGVAESWRNVSETMQIPTSLAILKDEKLICDVPRKQDHPDSSIWRNGLVTCVESGYDWIHYPLPVSSKADHSMPSSTMLASVGPESGTLIGNSLASLDTKTMKLSAVSAWHEYVSHWGVASPFDWNPNQQQWSFIGQKQQNVTAQIALNNSDNIFRCVAKILTVMLFLRLQELGLLSIDDEISGLSHKVTWRQVFTNTAGTFGEDAGGKFKYSNSLWKSVADFVQIVTGVSFIEAVQYYILDPIGLIGSFDVNTTVLPFTARGYFGSNEDLLLIGSTLASGGVSPKTRLRVISSSSVDEMLKDWTSEQNVTESFSKDFTVRTVNRTFRGSGISFPFEAVDGYGMGIWRVKGWRKKGNNLSPVRGWIAMGGYETILYFDTDDIVVGMCAPKAVKGIHLTYPFAKFISQLGARIDAAFTKSDGLPNGISNNRTRLPGGIDEASALT